MVDERGLIRPRDVLAEGIPRQYLDVMVRMHELKRWDSRLLSLPGRTFGAVPQVAMRVPRATLCLLSALSFHGVLKENPDAVWIAIDRRARKPRIETPRIRTVRFSGPMLTAGVERFCVGGVELRVYSVAKTIADCFRYRRVVGEKIGPETLDRALDQRLCKIRDLILTAQICRVWHRIAPLIPSHLVRSIGTETT